MVTATDPTALTVRWQYEADSGSLTGFTVRRRTADGPLQTVAVQSADARAFVDRVALVPDAAIRDAQSRLWRSLRIAAEPGGAAALAALLCGAYKPAKGERVCVLVCGGNTTAVDFDR